MVTPVRTSWTNYLNYPGGDGVVYATLAHMSKDLEFRFFSFWLAAGWTVKGTSDGTTASSSNNITSSADIVQNSAGSAHSWWWLESPAGFITAGKIQVVVDINTVTLNPTSFSVVWSYSGFSGGSTTARPTAADEKVMSNSTVFTQSGYPNERAHPYHFHGLYSDIGELICFFERDGSAGICDTALLVLQPMGGPFGAKHMASYFAHTTNPRGALDVAALQTTSNWTAIRSDGTTISTGITFGTLADAQVDLTNGRDGSDNLQQSEIYLKYTSGGNRLGVLADVWACPNQAPNDQPMSGDSGLYRFRTRGSLILTMPDYSRRLMD